DPDGRVAMAVARTQGVRTEDRIVAVDSSRLAAVAQLPGQDPAELARRLHPPVPTVPTIGDGPLTLEAQGQSGLAADETVTLRLNLSTVDGVARVADFGALAAGRRTYSVVVSGCPAGCRLVGLELVAPRLLNVGKDVTVQVYGLSQP